MFPLALQGHLQSFKLRTIDYVLALKDPVFSGYAANFVRKGFKIQRNLKFGHFWQMVKGEEIWQLGILNPEAFDNILQGTCELGVGLREGGQILEVDFKGNVGVSQSDFLLDGLHILGA